jgi:hypothetical protein
MLSTPFSRSRAEVSSAENPPPMKSTSTSSTIGARGTISPPYGSLAYLASSPFSSEVNCCVPSGR